MRPWTALRLLLVESRRPLYPTGRWRSCLGALRITGCDLRNDSVRLLRGPLHRLPTARKPPCHRRRDLACGFRVRIKTLVRYLFSALLHGKCGRHCSQLCSEEPNARAVFQTPHSYIARSVKYRIGSANRRFTTRKHRLRRSGVRHARVHIAHG
jgi:hypothetical protein